MSVLWSVLAGIGTVLLFLLKGVGILLLVVLVLGLLLMFCPFCADVQWAEGIFQVKAGALGITFPVFRYPAPEKPEKKKKIKRRKRPAHRSPKGSPAPPEGEADPADRLHHLKRGGKAHPGHHRLPALYPDRRCPRCPGRRPCRGCPQLWQAERLALPDAGFPGPVPLSGLRAAPAPAGFRQRRAHRKGSRLLPGHGPGLCHRFHASARSVRVLARKGTGRFYLARV